MNTVIDIVVIVSLVAHGLLLLYALMRGSRARVGQVWLALTVLLSLAAAGAYLLPPDIHLTNTIGREFITVVMLTLALTIFGGLVTRDVLNRQPKLWLVLNAIWLVALIGAALASETVTVGQPEWLITTFAVPTVPSLIALLGLALLGIYLLGTAFYAFYIATLPEVANRALFWVLDAAIVLMGVVLAISGTDVLVLVGLLLVLMGVAGAVYAQITYRVFNIRGELSAALRTLLLLIVTAAIIFSAITLALNIEQDDAQRRLIIIAALALGVALVYIPARQLAEAVINRLMSGTLTDPTEATRRYSQEVSKAVELDQLVKVSAQTLNEVMRVRRSGLILVDSAHSAKDSVDLQGMMGGDGKPMRGTLSKASPIWTQLATRQAPLSQFDIEFSPDYVGVPTDERQFFHELHMSAYAPILADSALIGILACGPKTSDAPFYPRDLQLLATMANQTGVALRNARLVADLRRLNEEAKALNAGLEGAKEQMEKLDAVKTDFVTIASHELRTPLAQIRGYTDIIDALNEQGMLDKDQMTGMVSNLRKATERMEELIGAMLDVSQLDVNAMDLRFAQASLESVMRMAIEPLTDAIKQRKLTLSARGLRGLPTIQADMQRLVQAFRNVVLNAIKFTPDGGRIEITATLQAAKDPDARDHILVSITDTGVGIDKENLELIFTKFFRAYDPGLHSTGAYKFLGAGPGLGLTIARGVIEGHGGKIWAESPGHSMETYPGATFYVLLPVSPPEDARRVLPFAGAAEAATDANLVRAKV